MTDGEDLIASESWLAARPAKTNKYNAETASDRRRKSADCGGNHTLVEDQCPIQLEAVYLCTV